VNIMISTPHHPDAGATGQQPMHPGAPPPPPPPGAPPMPGGMPMMPPGLPPRPPMGAGPGGPPLGMGRAADAAARDAAWRSGA
jgi:hypothetical protein